MVTPNRYSDRVSGFTKLFGTIIHSTIWQEAQHVKVVWITMLAMSDRHGIVEASIPGLAKASGVTLAESEEALGKLLGPDPYSRTKEHEGRRIEEVPGGWRVLNYLKYRQRIDVDAQRMATGERVRRHREKKRQAVTVTESNGKKRQAEAEAEAEADPDIGSTVSEDSSTSSPYPALFETVYSEYPKKESKGDALKAWTQLKPTLAIAEAMVEAIRWQRDSPKWKEDNGQFVPGFGKWLRARRWEDEKPKRPESYSEACARRDAEKKGKS